MRKALVLMLGTFLIFSSLVIAGEKSKSTVQTKKSVETAKVSTANTAATPTANTSDNPVVLNGQSQEAKGPRAGEQINWDVIASGGGPMSSTNFLLDGTLGQMVAGESTSPNFALNAGYWQNFAAAQGYLCGDVDDNNQVDITDAVFLVNYIFASGSAPDPLSSGDVDCNNQVDITDAVYIVNYIFASGAVPCAACP